MTKVRTATPSKQGSEHRPSATMQSDPSDVGRTKYFIFPHLALHSILTDQMLDVGYKAADEMCPEIEKLVEHLRAGADLLEDVGTAYKRYSDRVYRRSA